MGHVISNADLYRPPVSYWEGHDGIEYVYARPDTGTNAPDQNDFCQVTFGPNGGLEVSTNLSVGTTGIVRFGKALVFVDGYWKVQIGGTANGVVVPTNALAFSSLRYMRYSNSTPYFTVHTGASELFRTDLIGISLANSTSATNRNIRFLGRFTARI